jgi:hypothetical protein
MRVATNHMFTRIMANFDRSRIKPLELAYVMDATHGVVEVARFHWKLFKVQ